MNDCAAQHFGLWMVQGRWISAAVQAYNAGSLPKSVVDEDDDQLYSVDSTGIARVSLSGPILKGKSSFGGASSTMTRRALRTAERDADVKGIMLMIDSPGGSVSGLKPMADEVAAIARRGIKPIVTHAEDSMHSAALWTGVQSQRVTASPMTEIGSIGTVATVTDYSGAAEKDGIKVHVVSTGPMKGAFTPGAEITDEQLGWLQGRVDQMNAFFLDAVKRGRKLSAAKVRDLATGEDWMAADAKANGLIDDVMSEDDAIESFRRMIKQQGSSRQSSANARRRAAMIVDLGG